MGLLVRSPQFERPDAAGACATTGSGPFQVLPPVTGDNARRLPDQPSSGDYVLAGDQRCFRYSPLTSIVPLRNVIVSDM